MSGPPNPLSLLNRKPNDLPHVEPLGTIDLKTLNQYHCNNPDRRLISLFGKVYDVTAAEQSYGSDGAYKGWSNPSCGQCTHGDCYGLEFAGHDMTLAISKSKMDSKWLDRFVKMKDDWVESAKGWEQ